ncbi:MAG: NYN domain-containing protein [Pseudomonadota bacterium]
MPQPVPPSARIAVLADCDNSSPEALAFALSLAPAQSRIVLRQGYGNDFTMEQPRWRDALNRLAFTPLHQFGTGKNAADIALALDALELLFENRADTFYLLTSDADFTALCRKLRLRGGSVVIVGQAKTPAMLREACDSFHEFVPATAAAAAAEQALPAPAVQTEAKELLESIALASLREESNQQLIQAVAALAKGSKTGWVGMGELGHHMSTTYPAFSATKCKHKGLVEMVKALPEHLSVQRMNGGDWVQPVIKTSPRPA